MFFKLPNGSNRHVDPSRMEDLANLKVTDARPGDTLSINGAGDQFADLDFTVDRRAMVESGERKWTELGGPYRDRRVTLEIHNDDDVEVLGSFDGRHLTLDQIGLSEQDLTDIDDRQNPADNFEFENKVWMYRWSREVGVFRDSEMQGTGYYQWQFQEENGTGFLTVRKQEGQPFGAYVSQKVNPGDITVYRG
jgi:hypothetical protein